MRRLALILAVLLVSIVLAGCGIRDPYTQPPRTRPTAPPVTAGTTAKGRVAGSARQVIAWYAAAWVNWSAATLPSQRRVLRRLATGQLAVQLRRDAAQALRTRLEEVSGAYSRGRLVGVIAQAGGRSVVVTFEQAASQGGPAQSAYHVYLARTRHTTHGWKVIEWQPASEG